MVYHHEFDPYVDPERYYFSLLLLFIPWRKEEDLLGNCKTYEEAFKINIKSFPRLQEYHNKKQKIIDSKNQIDEKVEKRLEKMEEEGAESEPEELETDDISALDQALGDLEAINNVDIISTETATVFSQHIKS